jgi:hypothetical protein
MNKAQIEALKQVNRTAQDLLHAIDEADRLIRWCQRHGKEMSRRRLRISLDLNRVPGQPSHPPTQVYASIPANIVREHILPAMKAVRAQAKADLAALEMPKEKTDA